GARSSDPVLGRRSRPLRGSAPGHPPPRGRPAGGSGDAGAAAAEGPDARGGSRRRTDPGSGPGGDRDAARLRRGRPPGHRGRRVVAVEDTSTTGGSVLTACEALSEAGAEIAAVAVIVHRSEASRQAVEAAGHRYLAAYDISELEI